MLHAAIPAVAAGKLLLAEATLALLRWLTVFMPAAGTNLFEAQLESIQLFLRGNSRLTQPGGVHTALVLREEVLAVKVVRNAIPASGAGTAVVFCVSADTSVL